MPDRPLRADARQNREKILRAAREAFAESGYDVPLDEIAVRAGVGPGTVYRHFPAKDALFQAVVAARIEDLLDDARAPRSCRGPRQRLLRLSRPDRRGSRRQARPARCHRDSGLAAGCAERGTRRAAAPRPGVRRRTRRYRDRQTSSSSSSKACSRASGTHHRARPDPALRDRVLAIITDGLRQPAERTLQSRENQAVLTSPDALFVIFLRSPTRRAKAWVEQYGCGGHHGSFGMRIVIFGLRRPGTPGSTAITSHSGDTTVN